MSGRHEGRLLAVQFLFQRDFNSGNLERALRLFWMAFPDYSPKSRSRIFSEELIYGVERERDALDQRLRACAEHWDVARMNAVDRNIMRVALYEMLYRGDIPPVVSINEAVELAKSFGGSEAGRFVNGILDRVRRELPRPARLPVPPRPDDLPEMELHKP